MSAPSLPVACLIHGLCTDTPAHDEHLQHKDESAADEAAPGLIEQPYAEQSVMGEVASSPKQAHRHLHNEVLAENPSASQALTREAPKGQLGQSGAEQLETGAILRGLF